MEKRNSAFLNKEQEIRYQEHIFTVFIYLVD